MSIAFVCYSCGNRLEVAEYTRKKIRCPSCGVMCEVPRPSDMTRSEEPAAQESRSGPRRRAATPRNDALQPSPSSAAGAIAAGPPPRAPASEQPLTDITAAPPRPTTLPQSQCPQCHELLAPGTKACPVCCYELPPAPTESREEPKTRLERLARRWESGWPLAKRVRLLSMALLAGLGLGVLGAFLHGDVTVLIGPLMLLAVLLAFILGTFDRIELTQTERGKLRLTRTWRVCFAERRPVRIYLKNYQGVITGMGNEADSWAWLMLFLLLPFGLFPGFLWWYYVIRKDTYFVALSEGHVSVDLVLYRGMNERQAEEIAQTLQEVASLPRVL